MEKELVHRQEVGPGVAGANTSRDERRGKGERMKSGNTAWAMWQSGNDNMRGEEGGLGAPESRTAPSSMHRHEPPLLPQPAATFPAPLQDDAWNR